MYLHRLHIDGYGVFHDREIAFEPGLNVVYGPNETGKSTLLALIRQVLYGFPDGRSNEKIYPALHGGRWGGRIFLQNRQGQVYQIERYHGSRGGSFSIVCPDGSFGAPDDLALLLGQTTKDVFSKVFAFGLSELQTIKTLDDRAVSAHIYSAGASGISVAEIEQALEQNASELFAPRGRKPEINALLSDIEEAARSLAVLSGKSSDYNIRIRERDDLNKQIDQEEREIKTLDESIGKCQRLANAWDVWCELNEAEEALAGLPEVGSFPEDGLTRLERLEERQDEEQSEKIEYEQEIAGLQQQLKVLIFDDAILVQAGAIESLRSDRNKYESAYEDYPGVEQEKRSIGEEIQEKLRRFGPDWNENRLEKFDDSIPAGEKIRGYREKLNRSMQDERDAEHALEDVHIRLEELVDEAATLRTQVENADALDSAQIEQRRQDLRRLQSALNEYLRLGEQRSQYEGFGRDLEEQMAPASGIVLPVWGAYISATLGVAGGIILAMLDYIIPGVIWALMFLAFAGLYAAIRRTIGRSAGTVDSRLKGKLEENRNTLSKLDDRLTALRDAIRKDATVFETGDIPSQDQLDQLSEQFEQEMDTHRERKTLEKRLREMDGQIEKRKNGVSKAENTLEQAQQARIKVEAEWASWLESYDIKTDITPDGVIEIFGVVQAAREKLKQRESLQERIGRMKAFIEEYEGRVREICKACGRTMTEGSVLSVVDGLLRDLEQAQKAAGEKEQIESRIADHHVKLNQQKQRLKALQKEEAALLENAEVIDRESFRQKAAIFEERHRWLGQQQQARHNLERLLGKGDACRQAIEILSTKTPETFDRELADLQKQKRDIEETLSENRDERGRLNQQIDDLERDEEASEKRLEFNALQEKLDHLAREWSIWTLGHALIEEARRYYEQERQPGVIKEAEQYFTRITDNSYTHVQAPLDGTGIYVQDRHGARKELGDLSRGTAEQLYFALRLGLIREFGRKAEPLPVIMDDIMVNFDAARARQAVLTLSDFVMDHQVILLTCHESTVELFQEYETEFHCPHSIITLDRDFHHA